MDVLIHHRGDILEGFGATLALFVISAFCALALGTLLAALRVCPVPVLRWCGTAYVAVIRNTPLLLLFVLMTFGAPNAGLRMSFFKFAVLTLTIYSAAFVCEAIRSGINAVDAGQAEAARALGLTFRQNLTVVVLPQAARTVIPPLASVFIAHVRNTAVAGAFGVVEASNILADLLRDEPQALYAVFLGIAAGYMLIVLAVATLAKLLERRLVVVR